MELYLKIFKLKFKKYNFYYIIVLWRIGASVQHQKKRNFCQQIGEIPPNIITILNFFLHIQDK